MLDPLLLTHEKPSSKHHLYGEPGILVGKENEPETSKNHTKCVTRSPDTVCAGA
jgi:hypothetical protein